MMKRFVIVVIALTLFLPAMIAHADLIAEPDNDFFSRYRNDCVYLGRSFCVPGEGSANVKKAPDSDENAAITERGEIIYVDYSCLFNGSFWGFTQRHNGWIKLDEFLVLYDYVAFEEEHLAELYTYTGDYAELKETKAAAAWPWPGADAPLWTIEDLNTDNFRVLHAYKDPDGREWGFVTYLYGSPNIWFCLSDPLNKEIPAYNPAPEPAVWISETPHNDIANTGNDTLTIIIALVAALVIGTIILIKVFWKQNKDNRG